MSQSLTFWRNCWIYTKKSERENIKFIVKRLNETKSICLSQLLRDRKTTHSHSMRVAILYLLAGRVVRVQQHNEVRVYTLTDNWLANLKKLTTPYIKPKYNYYTGRKSVIVNNEPEVYHDTKI